MRDVRASRSPSIWFGVLCVLEFFSAFPRQSPHPTGELRRRARSLPQVRARRPRPGGGSQLKKKVGRPSSSLFCVCVFSLSVCSSGVSQRRPLRGLWRGHRAPRGRARVRAVRRRGARGGGSGARAIARRRKCVLGVRGVGREPTIERSTPTLTLVITIVHAHSVTGAIARACAADAARPLPGSRARSRLCLV